VDTGKHQRKCVSGRPGIDRRVIAGTEPDFDLRAGADCASTSAECVETFPDGDRRTRAAWALPEWDLFFGCGKNAGIGSSGNKTLRERKECGDLLPRLFL
jgi:hypothetical protein